MKISIAMATYNGEPYLAAQLDSFVAQTRLPDELVITDDGSTDATAGIVAAFAARAPFPVTFKVNPRRLGVMLNFDHALGACAGDLVLLSDQDDVWFPSKIEALERAAGEHPDKGCFINDAMLTDGDLHPVGTTKMGQIESSGLPAAIMVQGCCTAFRRALLQCLLPIPQDQQAHDNWLVQMANMLDQVVRLRQPLQYYRRHGGNVSDFFVNRLQTPGRRQRLGEWLKGVLRRTNDPGGLAAEQRFHAAAARRLHEHHAALRSVVADAQLQAVSDKANARSCLLARRQTIRHLPHRQRPPLVRQLWREGGYALSGGRAGAIKDLLLSRQVKTDGP